ncbi:long-chain-fatty-acid--CoA ligase 1-like [Asterias rubens]|uniref:long-chain-fatty-acid--CoA ligase 1-like n=1 Tax=Asterias rubens TaxID=7604 RepID=UPI001455C86C|nr:long-chain-fatty-acid--CoA ligase 1-like [Asterias rubens]XP_033643775.1 long-chain-fatty-acid--CoA ligase 1-like [Asterias rubens]
MAQVIEYLAEHPVVAVAATAAALGTTAMMFGGQQPVKPPFSLSQQSVELPGPEHIHVSPLCDYKNGQHVVDEPCYAEVPTCYETLLHGMKVSGDGPCLGWRTSSEAPFQWMSYSQVQAHSLSLGSALIERGCTPSNSTNIGIFSQNRPEWVIMDRACIAFSMVAVALYDTLGNEACEHIIGITQMSIIFIDKAAKLKTLLGILNESSTVKLIVLMDGPIPDEMKMDFEKQEIEIILYQDLMEIGNNNPHEPKPPSKDDTCSICFTSGTTGIPKGAIMTHNNFMTDIKGLEMFSEGNCWMREQDTHLSYLPLAHQYERLVLYCLMQQGARIGFFQGDIKKLLDDVQALKPTVFPSVPRLLNRIYDKVLTSVNSGSWIKRALFNFAFNKKKAEVKSGIIRNDSMWDKLIFNKIQALLGGNVRWIITGSAPLSTDVIMFLRVAFGCFVSEGYGQTECTACATLTAPGDPSAGHVGAPIPSCMIKLADVPDMNYFAENNKGEVCFKGPILFKGYLKQPEKTKEAIDEDGWLHSGDVGEWLPNGTLKIIDRKKHIFKLSQGEYVAPERLESVYTQLPLVAQAFIFGDSLKSCLVAIIVPDEEELKKYAGKNNLSGSFKELCQLKEVKAAILNQIVTHGKEAGLKGFELTKDIHIHDELFSAENGLLTPTFKNKRATIADYFKDQITEMYRPL